MLLFPLISLSLTEDRQDKVHQGFYFDNQLALETFVAASSTKCNPVALCLLLKIRSPSLDPTGLHEIPQLETLTIGERSNFKIFLRTRKIMVMHSNEMGEYDLRTLVDRNGSVDTT